MKSLLLSAFVCSMLSLGAASLHADKPAKAAEGEDSPAKSDAKAEPVNAKCPVSGEGVDPTVTTIQDGKTVGFCCAGCIKDFKKDPKKYMAKIAAEGSQGGKEAAGDKEHKHADKDAKKHGGPADKKAGKGDAKPINTVCPISGHDVDPATTVKQDGKTVAFCCADCVDDFKKDPKKYMAKIAAEQKKEGEAGKDADSEETPRKGEEPAAAAGKPVNKFCAIDRENAVDPTVSTEYEGKTIGFCCEDCIKKFDANPEAAMAGLK